MIKLSTGMDSTLGNWRKLSAAAFGEDSAAVKLLDSKIAAKGPDEEVVANEGELILLLAAASGCEVSTSPTGSKGDARVAKLQQVIREHSPKVDLEFHPNASN